MKEAQVAHGIDGHKKAASRHFASRGFSRTATWRALFVTGVFGIFGTGFMINEPAAGADCSSDPLVTADAIYGTPCADVIIAEPGVTNIAAGDGDDLIVGHPAVETISGGDGDDVIYTDDAPAWIIGAPPQAASVSAACGTSGDDTCYDSDSSGDIFGGDGNDTIFGQRGNDDIWGEGGADRLFGGVGDDSVHGQNGNDIVAGGTGYDEVLGGPDNDLLRGDGSKDELINGGSEVDTLTFATGITPGFQDSDVPSGYPFTSALAASGERGVYVWLGALSGSVTSTAFNGFSRNGGGQDTIDATDVEDVVGTAFADYIVGDGGDNRLYGGGGGDVLVGQDGNDTLDGGGHDDHLDGGVGTGDVARGAGGSDYCLNVESSTNCDGGATAGADPRDTGTISVGRMVIPSDNAKPFSHLYLSGSSLTDDVTVTYDSGASEVRFVRTTASASFAADTNGCANTSATVITCTINASAGGKPLDSIVLSGWTMGDHLNVEGVPHSVGVVITGGEGADVIEGDSEEDVLIDGVGAWDDILLGYANSDALLNNDGRDVLIGGVGNDLLLSASLCDDDQLYGDEGAGDTGTDNASWASLSSSVAARLYVNVAGQPDASGAPTCTAGGLDDLSEINHLEGSKFDDWLQGDTGDNTIIGRAGVDRLYGREGDSDVVLANDGVVDAVISCGPGAADLGRRDSNDPGIGSGSGSGCEQREIAPPEYGGDE